MGTLTGDILKLDEHCPHKLPTSCRLTSTSLCCACADIRVHSTTYSVYVDGVGFVQRGTRWQGYCWYCKEFWNNRVAATDPPIPLTRCRIPEVPDQTEFVEAWFDFHKGYKIEIGSDGQTREVPLEFEPWIEVPPGYLPRLTSELRSGQAQNRGVFHSATNASEIAVSGNTAPERTVEDAIDELLNELSDEESHPPQPTSPTAERPSTGPTQQITRDHRRSRREGIAERMARVFGTREEIASDDYQSPIGDMFARAWRRYQAVQSAETSQEHPAPPRPNANTEEQRILVNAQQVIQEDQAISILRSNLTELGFDLHILEQVFGTSDGAEDGTFSRWRQNLFELDQELLGRHRRVRQEIQNAGIPPGILRIPTGYRSLAQALEGANQTPTFLEATRDPRGIEQQQPSNFGESDIVGEARAIAAAAIQLSNIIVPLSEENPSRGLDNDKTRPPAKTEGELTVKLGCQICYTQLATQAVLPCGHMCMCSYCAEIAMPTLRHARTTPQAQARCPVCRKKATSIVRIHY